MPPKERNQPSKSDIKKAFELLCTCPNVTILRGEFTGNDKRHSLLHMGLEPPSKGLSSGEKRSFSEHEEESDLGCILRILHQEARDYAAENASNFAVYVNEKSVEEWQEIYRKKTLEIWDSKRAESEERAQKKANQKVD